MAYILQVDFPHDGVFGQEFTEAFTDLAKDISGEDGLLWKIWTENKDEKTAGGIYYFKDIRAKIFEANKELSKISKTDFLV